MSQRLEYTRRDRSIVDDEAKRAEIEDASTPSVVCSRDSFFFPPLTLDDSFKTIVKARTALQIRLFSGAPLRRAPPPGKDDAPAMLIAKEAFPERSRPRSFSCPSRTNLHLGTRTRVKHKRRLNAQRKLPRHYVR